MRLVLLLSCAAIPIGAVHRTGSPPCPTQTFYAFQTTRPAQFLADSGLAVHPLPSVPTPRNMVAFVVDTNGAVIPETFKMIVVTDHDVMDEARASLSRWRYSPAMVGECRVRERVLTPIGRGS